MLDDPLFSNGVRVAHFLSFFVLFCYVSLCFPSCDVRHDFRLKTMFDSSLPPAVCRRAHVLFTVFVLVCIYCLTHIVLCFCCVCLSLVYPILTVSLDCSFLIVLSVFSGVYLQFLWIGPVCHSE